MMHIQEVMLRVNAARAHAIAKCGPNLINTDETWLKATAEELGELCKHIDSEGVSEAQDQLREQESAQVIRTAVRWLQHRRPRTHPSTDAQDQTPRTQDSRDIHLHAVMTSRYTGQLKSLMTTEPHNPPGTTAERTIAEQTRHCATRAQAYLDAITEITAHGSGFLARTNEHLGASARTDLTGLTARNTINDASLPETDRTMPPAGPNARKSERSGIKRETRGATEPVAPKERAAEPLHSNHPQAAPKPGAAFHVTRPSPRPERRA